MSLESVCTVEQRATHRALAEQLGADPRVAAVDVLAPADDASGEWTTSIVLEPGETRVPARLLAMIARRGMGIVDVTPRAAFDHLRVTIR